VEAQWRVIDPILDAWGGGHPELVTYPAGSAGPAEADRLLEPGHAWRAI
jgi:glucose-6-phosphate 1-dehydrogenase